MNNFILMTFNRLNAEHQLKIHIEQLWSDIAEFETNERKHDFDNIHRENARMEAYVKLQENKIDEIMMIFKNPITVTV